ncbi:uncharacterized protein K452DRAFT_200233, partial [Aplosporella prunicola CBS 121167]
IFTGVWTNWSYGAIRGSTLTLSRSNGNFLVAALALFVTTTGACFWRIVCFALHHWLSSEFPQDGLYHQRQAILRTSGTGVAGALALARTAWAWRKNATNISMRTVPIVALAITVAATFGAAGVFSSRISSSMGKEVLLTGKDCGWIAWVNASLYQQGAELVPYASQITSSSSDYNQRCYSKGAGRQDCPTFVQINLPTTVDGNYSCPFADAVCKSRYGNIRLDTGYLNSHHHLGMNAPKDERILYRRVTECAPLNTDNYTLPYPEGRNITSYFYGTNVNGVGTTQLPITAQFSTDKPFKSTSQTSDYSVMSMVAFVDTNKVEFVPIKELQRNDADVSLHFFSSNNVLFADKSDDAIYSAHTPCAEMRKGNDSTVMYCRDQPVTVLACAHQHQICDATKSPDEGCQPLLGFDQTVEWQDTHSPFSQSSEKTQNTLTPSMWKAQDRLTSSMWFGSSIVDVLKDIGISALTARKSLSGGHQGLLPNTQWQKEVENLHLTSLAALQRQVIESANGPPSFESVIARPKDSYEKKICKNQKVTNYDYSSFSVLGLVILLSVGTLVIVVSYCIESIAETVQKRKNWDTYSRLEWIANDTLQLQRLAHEELGLGTWSVTDGSNPITKKGERLAILDISERGHPKLKPP